MELEKSKDFHRSSNQISDRSVSTQTFTQVRKNFLLATILLLVVYTAWLSWRIQLWLIHSNKQNEQRVLLVDIAGLDSCQTLFNQQIKQSKQQYARLQSNNYTYFHV